uniref:Endothelin-converting enzyme 1 n=1 Tax=Macrostomum lignano TaxID=282301 RepID=A0A1I8G6G6_9PLAT
MAAELSFQLDWIEQDACLMLLLIAVLSILLLVFVLLYALSTARLPPGAATPKHPSLCTSEACISASALLQSHIDRSADPCQDFYSFACGGFHKSHPFTAETVGSVLQEDNSIQGNLFEMMYFKNLSKPRDASEAQLFQTLRSIYGTCMDWRGSSVLNSKKEEFLPNSWQTGERPFDMKSLVRPLLDFLEGYSGIEDFLARLVISGTSDLFRLSPGSVERSLRLHSSPYYLSTLKSWNHVFNDGISALEDFSDLIDLNLTVSINQMKPAVQQMLNKGESYLKVGPYHLEQLQNFTQFEAENLNFNWTEFYSAVSKYSANKLPPSMRVKIIRYPLLFFVLEQLTTELEHRQGPYYDFIRLDSALSAVNFLPDESFKFFKNLFGQQKYLIHEKEGRNSSRLCMDMMLGSMPPVALQMFSSAFVTDDFNSVKVVIGDIKEAMWENVDSEAWIEQPSKAAIKKKLDAIRSTVGYPQFNMSEFTEGYSKVAAQVNQSRTFGDVVLQFKSTQLQNRLWILTADKQDLMPSDIFSRMFTVNAHYSLHLNSLFIYLGLLLTKVYMKGYPDCLLYGGIGGTVGHEVGHAFDKLGNKKISVGEEQIGVFDNVTALRYDKQSQCLADFYNQIIDPEFAKSDIWDNSMNAGVRKFDENFADIVGINSASEPTEAVRQREKLAGLTPDQLFFIHNAQLLCTKAEKNTLISVFKDKRHSPPHPRVNGQVMQSKDFARVFKCKPGDPMYLTDNDKCHFW